MKGTEFAIPVASYDIEDHAIRLQVRIVLTTDALLEQRRQDVAGYDMNGTLAGACPRDAAVFSNHIIERRSHRILMRPLDIGPRSRIGDGPQGGNALVRIERKVDTGRAFSAAAVVLVEPSGPTPPWSR